LEGALETFDVGVKFMDVILESLDPVFLLSEALTTFFLAIVDKLCNIVGQPFILHVVDIGEGGMDSSDDGWGKGSRMYRWLCWSIRYGGGVEEVGGPLDKVCFSRDGEEGGCVLLLSAVANVLSNSEKLRVVGAVFVHGVGTIRDEVIFGRDVGGAGRLTG